MKRFILLLVMALSAYSADYKLTIDSRNGVKIDGTLRVGRFIQRKDKTILVAHMRKPTHDEVPFIKKELHESPFDCQVMDSVNGHKMFLFTRHMVSDFIDESQRSMTTPALVKYLEEHGGDWCMRGDVYGVQGDRITFCGWYSQRTMGWDAKNGEDAIWGAFRITRYGLPLPFSFEEGMEQKEQLEKQEKP